MKEEYEYIIRKYVSSWSYKINYKLREKIDLDDQDKEDIKLLDNALDMLPNYKGNLVRYVHFYNEDALTKFLKKHIIDTIVIYNEYMSTTKYGNIYNKDAQVILYILDSSKGKDISIYNPKEKEVLYPRNSSFKIKDIDIINNRYHILLEEV